MRRTLLRVLAAFLLVGLFVWLGWRHLGQLGRILAVPGWVLAALMALFFVMRGLQAEVFRAVLPRMGVPLSFYRCGLLAMVISLSNLLLPHVGSGAPGIFLKSRHKLRLSDFLSILLPTYLFQITSIGLAGLLCQAWLWVSHGRAGTWALTAALAGCLVGSLVIYRLPMRLPAHWDNRVARFLRRLLDSWAALKGHPGLIARVFGIQMAVLLVQALRLWGSLAALGAWVPPPAVILASFLGQLGMLVGLTPGGLGFREAAIVLGASLLGVDVPMAVAGAVLDRAVMVLCILLAGPPSLYLLTRRGPAIEAPAEAHRRPDADAGPREQGRR